MGYRDTTSIRLTGQSSRHTFPTTRITLAPGVHSRSSNGTTWGRNVSIRTLVVASSGEITQPIADVICSHPEFELLANCRDSFEALQWMEESNPDLLLLDVELPGMNGIELIGTLGRGAPAVIFLSDSPLDALRAFEMEAIDLVRKPLTHERLHHAFWRAKQYIRKPAAQADIQQTGMDRLLLRSGGRLIFLEPREVHWIEANDNYVVFHTGNERHTVRMTMSKLESMLRPGTFVRIHRSTIVNIEQVRELRPLAHGDYSVVLSTGHELTLTRSYRRHVRQSVPDWPL
jgi:two-component system LytT family response regulator